MSGVNHAGPRAGSSGGGRRAARPAAVLAACAVAALAAACSSGGSPGSGGQVSASHSSAAVHAMSAGTALSLAASHASQVTSFSATIDSTTSGSAAVHVSGQVTEQVKPVVLAREVFHVTTSSGQGLPGRMEVVLTGKAVYLKMSVLAKQVGKPWVRMSFASLKKASGISMAPLLHQLQGSNPLAQAQMLSVAKNVRQIGRGTVNGVPVTGYAGTLNVAQALARLSPQMRSELGPALSQAAARTVRFTAWVDDQHVMRKIVEIAQLNGGRVSTVITITAINQPVRIHAPPASQVAKMPGL